MHSIIGLDLLVDQRRFHIYGYMFKILYDKIKLSVLTCLFETKVDVHVVNTYAFGRNNLIKPACPTVFGARSIKLFDSKMWNLLPRCLRECKAIESFTRLYWKLYSSY